MVNAERCDVALDGLLADNIRLLSGTQLVKLVLFFHVMISCFVGIFFDSQHYCVYWHYETENICPKEV